MKKIIPTKTTASDSETATVFTYKKQDNEYKEENILELNSVQYCTVHFDQIRCLCNGGGKEVIRGHQLLKILST
jgi:hypothetical protein